MSLRKNIVNMKSGQLLRNISKSAKKNEKWKDVNVKRTCIVNWRPWKLPCQLWYPKSGNPNTTSLHQSLVANEGQPPLSRTLATCRSQGVQKEVPVARVNRNNLGTWDFPLTKGVLGAVLFLQEIIQNLQWADQSLLMFLSKFHLRICL